MTDLLTTTADTITDERPYINEIACVGITSWKGRNPNGCDGLRLGVPELVRQYTGRYSVGPMPTAPDVNKSPRCPYCGGLVIELRRVG